MRKKLFVFSCAVLSILLIHACSYQMPSSVEIKGDTGLDLRLNPSNANLGNVFAKNVKKALKSNDSISVLDCYEKTDNTMTFLIDYLITIERDGFVYDTPPDPGITLPDTYPATCDGSYPGDNDGIISLSALNDYLCDFDIKGIRAYLYVDGGSFIAFNESSPDVEIRMGYQLKEGGAFEYTKPWTNKGRKIYTGQPACDLQSGKYDGDFPPAGKDKDGELKELWPGEPGELELILNERPIQIKFEYTVKAAIKTGNNGKNTPLWLDILLKLPMNLKAKTDGAYISFTEENDPDEEPKDIFSRTGGDDSPLEWINNGTLRMDLTYPVFDGGTLFLKDDTHVIKKELLGTTIVFSIDGADLEYINKTRPYNPKMSISFAKDKQIIIPWSLYASGIVFDANVNKKFNL